MLVPGGGGWAGVGPAVLAGARALVRPAGLRGLAVEAAWVGAHLALYPLGMAGDRALAQVHRLTVADLPPVQRALHVRDIVAAGTPILLVHGMVDNRSVFTLLRRGLRRKGFGHVATVNYSPFTADLRDAARVLAQRVEEISARTGYERIHVVGHSLGGLVARYYVQCLGGADRVHTLVTLGTPHAGTLAARALPAVSPLVRQLRPGSALLTELAAPAPGARTRVIAFWSDLDPLVVPARNARAVHPDLATRNVLVRGVGHMSLPIHPSVVREICTALAHLDPDGQTVTAGVTSLRAEQPGGRGRGGQRARAGHRGAISRSPGLGVS